MARGISDDAAKVTRSRSGGPAAVLKLIAFAVFSGAGVGLLAAVVLLPAYARLSVAQYELNCKKADITDQNNMIAFNERFAAAAAEDPVLIKRLAMNEFNLSPAHETVARDPSGPPPEMPGSNLPPPTPRPDKPDNKLLRYAVKLEKPGTRRGMFVIAIASLVAAMFMFAPSKE